MVDSAQSRSTSSIATDATPYTYIAPWGGFGAPGSIYVLGQGACNDIAATATNGFKWPAFLSTLAAGKSITISGVPAYNDTWSRQNGCPTGGIAASSVVLTDSSTASPSPVPTATAGSASTKYPINSTLFTAANNPFHMTISALVASGAKRQSQTLMENLWSQGYYKQSEQGAPIYSGAAGQPMYTIECTFYSSKGCNAQGLVIHLPAGAYPQSGSDHHIISVDSASHGEFDGWGGASSSEACSVGGGKVDCSWGGWYPFNGKGLANNGSSANHAGFAYGLFTITAQELLNGHIAHALGWNVACLDNPTVYPADTTNPSDYPCSGGHGKSPSAAYGQLVHLVWSASQIASSSYSAPCKTVLTAMATYGAYLYDDGNGGIEVAAENPQTYSGTNPWYRTIYPELVAGGDGSGSGSGFGWNGCLNRLSSNAFELYTIPNLGY